jgi:hypothetical protein
VATSRPPVSPSPGGVLIAIPVAIRALPDLCLGIVSGRLGAQVPQASPLLETTGSPGCARGFLLDDRRISGDIKRDEIVIATSPSRSWLARRLRYCFVVDERV